MNTRSTMRRQASRAIAVAGVTGLAVAGCSSSPYDLPAPTSPAPATSMSLSQSPTPSPSTPEPTPTPKPIVLPSLKGDTSNAIAFAPLDHPNRVQIHGNVETANAWSTSKVLVVLAYIDTVAAGDPDNLDSYQRSLIKRALTASDMDALLEIRAGIPGGSGAPMTAILRSIGDDQTTAPDIREGSMYWSLRNQVRFMAALANGEIVNRQTSRYVLDTMHPIDEHSWGLGTIGASNFKGGWLEPYTETRQMGIVDGYAVAIITTAGPAVVQTDGDSAHVEQLNSLADLLQSRLRAEAGRG